MLDEAIMLRDQIAVYTKAWGPRKAFKVFLAGVDLAGCYQFVDRLVRDVSDETMAPTEDDPDRAWDAQKEDMK